MGNPQKSEPSGDPQWQTTLSVGLLPARPRETDHASFCGLQVSLPGGPDKSTETVDTYSKQLVV